MLPGYASGDVVKRLHGRMQAVGHNRRPIDGADAPETVAAARALQRARGVDLDGVFRLQPEAEPGRAPAVGRSGSAGSGSALRWSLAYAT